VECRQWHASRLSVLAGSSGVAIPRSVIPVHHRATEQTGRDPRDRSLGSLATTLRCRQERRLLSRTYPSLRPSGQLSSTRLPVKLTSG
jgi:hypothetical protein